MALWEDFHPLLDQAMILSCWLQHMQDSENMFLLQTIAFPIENHQLNLDDSGSPLGFIHRLGSMFNLGLKPWNRPIHVHIMKMGQVYLPTGPKIVGKMI